jgi:hypothetical protein
MSNAFEPEPLPRNDVRRIYDTIAHSSQPLTLEEVTALCPAYSAEQVYWACGTMTRQDILRVGFAPRSDGRRGDPFLDVILPFDNYIGWEDAK